MSINSRLSKLEQSKVQEVLIRVTVGETKEQARKSAAEFLQKHPNGRAIFVGYESEAKDEHL